MNSTPVFRWLWFYYTIWYKNLSTKILKNFFHVWKSPVLGGCFGYEKSHSSPGGRVIFSHKIGNFTPGPW